MSDTQDDLDRRVEAVKQFCGCDERSSVLVDAVVRTCRAHFQRKAETVATILCPDPHDERDGVWLSLNDIKRLRSLPAGTELYTSPPIPAGMVPVPITKLKEIEWEAGHYNGCGYWVRTCIECNREEKRGHTTDCWLGQAIAAAPKEGS